MRSRQLLPRQPLFTRHSTAWAAAALVGSLAATPASAAVCTWNTTSGNWAALANWLTCVAGNGNPGGAPGPSDTATVGAAGIVTVNTAQNIGTLNNAGRINIDASFLNLLAGGSTNNTGGVVNIANGAALNQQGHSITGGTINTTGTGALTVISSSANFLNGVTLNGQMDMATIANSRQRVTGGLTLGGVANINNNGILSFEGTQTLGGTGSIVLGTTGGGNRIDFDGTGVTTFAAGVTVRGHTGTIGQQLNIGGTQTLVNNGTISADVAGGTISFVDSSVTNNGTLSALNGGRLVLGTNVTGGPAGQIIAGAGSQVLQSGVAISGTVNTSGGGLFSAISSSANFLDNVTLNGVLDMANIANSRERVRGGSLVLNGSININNNGILSFEGDSVLSGTGATIVLGATGGGNRIDLDGSGTTTFATGTTVRGQNGTIGLQINVGGTQTLVNNGTISADVAGGTITLTESVVSNSGTLSALNGGTLVLSSNVTGVGSGQILAGAGSQVLQNGVTLSGNINTGGSGLFSAISSSANRLTGVTLNGNLDMASIANSRQRVSPGGLVLNGTININNNGILSFEDDGTFSGNGTVVLGSVGGGNRIDLDGTGTTTFASGITVRGENGTIGQQINIGGTQTLVNNGTISADVAGGTLTITDSAVVNNGLLQAVNGGRLVLSSQVTGNAGGQIVAGTGSQVVQNGVTLSGTLNTSGSGLFSAMSSSGNRLTNVTLNGNLDMASIANSRERVSPGGLVLNGRVDINNNGILSFESDGVLSGNGVIVFGAAGAGNRIDLDGSGTTTVTSGITIRGHSGTIGQQINIGGTQTLVNNGTINAELAGGTISFADSALVNNGLARAQAGTMNITVPLSGTGTLQVDVTGLMNLANGAKTQGTLAMGATGAAINLGTGNLTLNTDYTNAGAGVGNSFNRRAGATGTGQIVAGGNAAQAITGAAVSNGATNNATLTIGNLRVGANTFNYQVANTGTTGPALRGALQTSVNGGNITDARLSGSGVASSNYNGGAPGANSGNLQVVFTAANAGALAALSGQAVNLRSAYENINDQRLNIVLAGGAAAYNAAAGAATPAPVVLANQRVGGTASQALTVTNTAAAGAFSEDLSAAFGANTGAATSNAGSINALLAGASNNSAMAVGVNTATAGAKTGTVTINYGTTGTVNGVSNGLAAAGANAPQTVAVSGNVYQVAAGALQSAPLNFGTLQVGQTVGQNLVVRNTASGAAGFVEDLNASFGAAGNSQITGTGGLTGILAGTNSGAGNGTLRVTVTGTVAGAINSSIAVNFSSAGAVAGVSNGLGSLAVGSEAFGVNGVIQAGANVINQASPLINTPTINLGAVRVGAAAPTGFVSITNTATAAPQAALNASIAPTTGPLAASGSFSLLTPGATNSTSLAVVLDTGTAGNYTGANAGTATISLVSDANNVGNCAPNCQLNLASQVVNVEGKVYTQAVGSSATGAINFGIVRVGDTVSARNIVINNTAAASALNDNLRGTVTGLSGALDGTSSIGGVASGASGNLAVTLSTASNGVFSQTATVSYLSQNADMADVAAGTNQQIGVTAQVNALAYAQMNLRSGAGTLSLVGNTYFLDLGTVAEGSSLAAELDVSNAVVGPADDLSGSFDLAGASGLMLTGWSGFTGLMAGADTADMGLGFMATGAGLFEREIRFAGSSVNASDPLGVALQRSLVIRANVQAASGVVPEPGSLALVLGAGLAAAWTRRRPGAGQAPSQPVHST